MIDLTFSPASNLSKFTQVENFIFDNIKSDHLENILIHLRSLPCLSSLTINFTDNVKDKDIIYREIFRLPVLKYCKLSLNNRFKFESPPIATKEFSPIEYLVITNDLKLDEMNCLLSYVPQLRHLSIHLLDRNSPRVKVSYSTQLNHLTHTSFNINQIPFDEFKLVTKNLFHHVEILHISIKNKLTYLDANQWEQFILWDMPNLRIFDIMISQHFLLCMKPNTCFPMIEKFNSSF